MQARKPCSGCGRSARIRSHSKATQGPAERVKTLVQRLLAFARRQPLKPAAVDIAALISGMADLVRSASGPRVRVELDLAPDLPPAMADANQVELAILNLAVNARDAMPDGGTLTLVTKRERVGAEHRAGLAPGDYVHLSVADTGVGMDSNTARRAIEPFFSTKGIGKGTGLGLSMAHGVASQLGGALMLSSQPGVGTVIDLWLPVSGEAARPQERDAGDEASAAAGIALLVDDEELVRSTTADMLTDMGYSVVEAGSAEQALELVAGGLGPDIVISDHMMPGMSGTELARKLRDIRPGLPVLIVSGYAEVERIAPEQPRLEKPFVTAELAAAVAALGQSVDG